MTREQALALLAEHSIESGDQPTACRREEDGTFTWFPGSSFFAEFGDHPSYDQQAVRDWLGY